MASRRWRDYRTPVGGRPVQEFLAALSDDDFVAVASAKRLVRVQGARAARHLWRDIFEVRAFATSGSYRIFFAVEGRRGQVLLALHAIRKQSRKTPPQEIDVAARRLRDWRRRRRR